MTEFVTSSAGPGSGTLTVSSDGSTYSWGAASGSPMQVSSTPAVPSSGMFAVTFQMFGVAGQQIALGIIETGYSDGSGMAWDYAYQAVSYIANSGQIITNNNAIPIINGTPASNGDFLTLILNADSNVGWFILNGGLPNAQPNGKILTGAGVDYTTCGAFTYSSLSLPVYTASGFHSISNAGSIVAYWNDPVLYVTGYTIQSDGTIGMAWQSLNSNAVAGITYSIAGGGSGTATGGTTGTSGTAIIPAQAPGFYDITLAATNAPTSANTVSVFAAPYGSNSATYSGTSGNYSIICPFTMPGTFTAMEISLFYQFHSGATQPPNWYMQSGGGDTSGPNFSSSDTSTAGTTYWEFFDGQDNIIPPNGSIAVGPPSEFNASATVSNWTVSGGRATFDVSYDIGGAITNRTGWQTDPSVTSFNGVKMSFTPSTGASLTMGIYVSFSLPETLTLSSVGLAGGSLLATGSVTNGSLTTSINLDTGSGFAPSSTFTLSGGDWTATGPALSTGTYTVTAQDPVTSVESNSLTLAVSNEVITLVTTSGTYGLHLPLAGTDQGGPASSMQVAYNGGTWTTLGSYTTTGGSNANWSGIGPALPYGTTQVQVRNAVTTSITSNTVTLNATIPIVTLPTYAPSPISLQKFIPSYLYQEYNDDTNVQAFVTTFNAIGQSYLDWFNTINYPVYANNPNVVADVLNWVGASLYGYPRPVLAGSAAQIIGAFGTVVYGELAYAANEQIGSTEAYVTPDDVYKRCLTWHLYKGDGRQFTTKWLKRRIMRFLYGVDGTDFVIDQTYPVSVAISGTTVTITLTGTPVFISSVFAAAVVSGALELPPFYTYDIVT